MSSRRQRRERKLREREKRRHDRFGKPPVVQVIDSGDACGNCGSLGKKLTPSEYGGPCDGVYKSVQLKLCDECIAEIVSKVASREPLFP